MSKPTGKLLFAYDTIRSLEEQALDLKALLLNEEGRILTLTAERDALRARVVELEDASAKVANRFYQYVGDPAYDKLKSLLPPTEQEKY